MDSQLKQHLSRRLLDSEPIKATKKLDIEDVYGRPLLISGASSLPNHELLMIHMKNGGFLKKALV